MKIRLEIDPNLTDEEVIIRAPYTTENVRHIQYLLEQTVARKRELMVRQEDSEVFLAYGEILFFEVSDDRVWAHTKDGVYQCGSRLSELEAVLPDNFVRSSRSGIINTSKVRMLRRSPTGVGEAAFQGSEKKTYISRMYYNNVRETIEETRLRK